MNRLKAVLAGAALLALVLYCSSVKAESNQSTLIFFNNTSFPLSLVVDKEHGHRCRVFVQYGTCSTYVTAGSHGVQAKYDDDTVAADDTFTVAVDETFEWTVYEEE